MRSSILLFCTLFLSAGSAAAQDVALSAFYRTGALTTIDREKGAVNTYSTSGDGTSLENVIGLGPSFDLALSPQLGITTSLNAGLVNGSFVSNPYFVTDSLDRRHFEVATSATLIEMAAAFRLRPGPFEIALGPIWDLFLGRSHEITLVAENAVRGQDSTSKADLPSVGRIALTFEAGYSLPIFTRPTIAATARYDPYVNRFRPIGDALQFGLRLTIPFRAGDPVDSALVQSAHVRAPDANTPVAPVRLMVDGRNIVQDSTLPVTVTYLPRQQYEELPLVVALDSLRFLTRSEAATWAERDVPFGAALTRDALNVVASRVRTMSHSRLLLECDSMSFLKLASYARTVWQDSVSWIPSRTLKGLVRISANDPVTLLPLAKRVVERSVTVPKIVVERGKGMGSYELTIVSGSDTLLRKVQSGEGSDNSVTQLPAIVQMQQPLSVTIAGDGWSVSRTLTLAPRASDTAVGRIEVALHPSHGNASVLKNRVALLKKLQGATSVTVHVTGTLDAEAEQLLQQLPPDRTSTPTVGDWTIRLEGALPN